MPGYVFDDACVPISPTTIFFDNGSFSGPQSNIRNNASGQELFEDFTLAQNAVITKITWQQHDLNPSTYVSTEVLIFPGLPYADPPVFSSTIVADRAPNATGPFGAYDGFDYEISGLSINLAPGTYWLGLNTNGGPSGWDNTDGGPDTILGFRMVNLTYPAPGLFSNGNLVFTLYGYVP
jgi:hypothetical protein